MRASRGSAGRGAVVGARGAEFESVGAPQRRIPPFDAARPPSQTTMKLCLLALAASASAFNFGAKKAPARAAAPTAPGTIATPQRWKWALGNPQELAQRAAARNAAGDADKAKLIPTPPQFMFAFGRPDVLAERSAARRAKWEWSSEFLSKARPDQGNYGAGDLVDDGLTVLERQQIAADKVGFLTGGAKIRYKRLKGQL